MIPIDKQYHFLAGLAISLILGLNNPLLGLVSAIIIGALKELFDWINRDIHTPDFYDFLATSIGGVVGFVLMIY